MNGVVVKSDGEIVKMREAGRRAALVLEKTKVAAVPGISTYDLDVVARDAMREYGVESAAYGYWNGKVKFPNYICISVNEELVHGIGRKDRHLKSGDIVSLDVAVSYEGFVGDNTGIVCLEPIIPEWRALVDAVHEALSRGIAEAVPGNRVGHISHAIQTFVESKGYGVVREFVGHGVGRKMHEEPQIPNFGKPSDGPLLRPGMTIAIEPMITIGPPRVEIADDGWVVRTKSGHACAHAEHTVLVAKDGSEILTKC